jgi:hypothetical protein
VVRNPGGCGGCLSDRESPSRIAPAPRMGMNFLLSSREPPRNSLRLSIPPAKGVLTGFGLSKIARGRVAEAGLGV